jgi:hypothetical protein
MGLCLRFSCFLIASVAFVSSNYQGSRSVLLPEPSLDQKQADLCELLREGHEDLLNEYPNEYYDCHAHSRFFKLGYARPSSSVEKPS